MTSIPIAILTVLCILTLPSFVIGVISKRLFLLILNQ